jgi:UDP-glucose 4-epimerase
MPPEIAGRRMAVVGGTGFIGSHLTEHLVRSGAEVVAIARSSRRLRNLEAVASDCRFVAADILERDSIGQALAAFAPEVVFHLAAEIDAGETFRHMAGSIASNAVGTANVLEGASQAGAQVLVYADSCKVFGNGPVPYRRGQAEAPICSYAIGKAAGWQLAKLAGAVTGMAVVGIRSTFTYGPRQNPNLITHVQDCVRRNAPVRLLGGSQTRDLLFVEDSVRAFVAAATEPAAWGSAVPIGGGRELGVIEICREIVRLLGSRIEVVPGEEQPRLTEIWRSYCDNAEARELFGWSPAVSLAEGLSRTLAADAPVASLP